MQQPNAPHVALPVVIFSMCILGVLVLSMQFWIQGLMRWRSGQRLIPVPEPRTVPCWGFVDILFAFFAFACLQVVGLSSGVQLGIGPPPGPDGELEPAMQIWIATVYTLTVVMVTAFIAVRCGVKPHSVGWSLARLGDDLRVGFKTFVVIAPPVYLLMVVVTVLSGKEYKHPIHDMANENPWMLLPVIYMAVILAPLGEEFAFRVLLQGFLESLSIGKFTAEKFLLGRIGNVESLEPNSVETNESTSPELAMDSRSMEDANPYVVQSAGQLADPIACEGDEPSLPWWPIIVSGVLFGLAHIGYGMSWIPLVVLGIVLGWLYRVTNRIWPSLVVHFCINAISMIGYSLTVLYGDPT